MSTFTLMVVFRICFWVLQQLFSGTKCLSVWNLFPKISFAFWNRHITLLKWCGLVHLLCMWKKCVFFSIHQIVLLSHVKNICSSLYEFQNKSVDTKRIFEKSEAHFFDWLPILSIIIAPVAVPTLPLQGERKIVQF